MRSFGVSFAKIAGKPYAAIPALICGDGQSEMDANEANHRRRAAQVVIGLTSEQG